MARNVLNIVETAYRATLEEQDDPVLWLCAAMRGAGAELAVLLRGNAVNYGVKSQDASGLQFGDKKQTQPPRIAEDLARLQGNGVPVYVVQDDLAERGIERTDLIDGLKSIKRAAVPALMNDYNQVWHW
jgi:sulfur relay (sulfurtransferase) DsrF/TusC family protein